MRHMSHKTEHLTRREVQILLMAASGLDSQRIGVCLHISHRTVEQHIAIMLHRVSASNRCELVARCFVAGIITRDRWPPGWSGSYCPTVP